MNDNKASFISHPTSGSDGVPSSFGIKYGKGYKCSDCDHYTRGGGCKDRKARLKNGGVCDGRRKDCDYWEVTG